MINTIDGYTKEQLDKQYKEFKKMVDNIHIPENQTFKKIKRKKILNLFGFKIKIG
jgi:hypothetical protein